MEILTGSKKVTAEPLLEYFDPLYKFLKRENEKNTLPHDSNSGEFNVNDKDTSTEENTSTESTKS